MSLLNAILVALFCCGISIALIIDQLKFAKREGIYELVKPKLIFTGSILGLLYVLFLFFI